MSAPATSQPAISQRHGWWALAALGGLAAMAVAHAHAEHHTHAEPNAAPPAPPEPSPPVLVRQSEAGAPDEWMPVYIDDGRCRSCGGSGWHYSGDRCTTCGGTGFRPA